jgi:hypothetical protein
MSCFGLWFRSKLTWDSVVVRVIQARRCARLRISVLRPRFGGRSVNKVYGLCSGGQ